MAKKINLTGLLFGRLTVIKEVTPKIHSYIEYECKCSCGNLKIIKAGHLTSGRTKSCGCLQKELASEKHSTHKASKTKEYKIWAGMLRRCYNKNDKTYQHYGKRGVIVCERWRHSFENFILDMGKCPHDKVSIDRLDNDKGYFKENCRWADSITQGNNRSSNTLYWCNGNVDTLANLCRKYNKPYKLIWRRIKNGLDIHDAIAIPKSNSGKRLYKATPEELINHFKNK